MIPKLKAIEKGIIEAPKPKVTVEEKQLAELSNIAETIKLAAETISKDKSAGVIAIQILKIVKSIENIKPPDMNKLVSAINKLQKVDRSVTVNIPKRPVRYDAVRTENGLTVTPIYSNEN